MVSNPIRLMSSGEEEEMWTQRSRVGKLCEDTGRRELFRRQREIAEKHSADTLFWDFSFQNREEISFCCLSRPICGTWLSQPEQMSILCFQPFDPLWTFVSLDDPHSVPFKGSVGWIASHPLAGIWGWMRPHPVTYYSSLGLLPIFLKFVELNKISLFSSYCFYSLEFYT